MSKEKLRSTYIKVAYLVLRAGEYTIFLFTNVQWKASGGLGGKLVEVMILVQKHSKLWEH